MVYYLASCVGLVFILKYGSILKWVRDPLCASCTFFAELFKCSLCLGFWAGFYHACYIIAFCKEIDTDWFLLPFVSAAVCWSMDSLVQMIQAVDVYLMSKVKR